MDLIDILFSKALLKSSGGEEINNDVATKEFVNAAINAIKNGVSEEHDTLKEIEDTLTTKLTNSPTEWPTWTKEQQAIARGNIGAADLESVSGLKTELVTSKDSATENTRFAIGGAKENLEVPSMDEFNQIKGDLTNKLPKSPADWPAWTADQQAKARERMSVENGSDFELLVDAVLEQEANTFLVQFPKPVRECMYHIWFYNNNGENVTAVTRCLDVDSTRYYLLKYTSNIKDAYGYVLNGYFRYNGPVSAKSVVGYASESTVSSWTSDVPGNGNVAYMNYPIETAMKKVDGIQFYLNSPSHVLNAGAVIKVWGR